MTAVAGADVAGVEDLRLGRILTAEALAFVAELERRFGAAATRAARLRAPRGSDRLAAGELPDFLPETRELRETDWVDRAGSV